LREHDFFFQAAACAREAHGDAVKDLRVVDLAAGNERRGNTGLFERLIDVAQVKLFVFDNCSSFLRY
jgi:hypothetical protein